MIEHLVQSQIDATLNLIYSALKPGGRMVVHTWPNRWHRQYTYPLTYAFGRMIGRNLPRDPRTKHEQLMHIAEQSPLELRANLRRAGFRGRLFLHHFTSSGRTPSEWIHWMIHSVPPFKWYFCDHILAIVTKPGKSM